MHNLAHRHKLLSLISSQHYTKLGTAANTFLSPVTADTAKVDVVLQVYYIRMSFCDSNTCTVMKSVKTRFAMPCAKLKATGIPTEQKIARKILLQFRIQERKQIAKYAC